ncbi:ACP S-malonyltransferase [Chitinophaga rhizophila]|uniref:[acyl-carrier-protein] S-malonyltransferase n=1 Tax=Chitinophaga rhizophila TaxID=2866212 RepID=A0ABS7GKN3_9BACT|nr:ACP S-malonyltransferase [Chitinophaga rhizophila]MBW8688283.1 ACP S-malonyltransferase [Chitinophaga rhizophila]
MKAFLFPGQGSQRKGMGKELFEKYPAQTSAASNILGYDIERLCVENPDRLLNETTYTQPALYVVNALSYLDRIEQESAPEFVLGHSLGEYVALFAASVFSFETGLQLVKRRAEIMGQVKNGGMAALIGLKLNVVEQLLADNGYTNMDIANYNSAEQIVISGTKDDIAAAQALFERKGAKLYYPLNVSGAFHSRYMKTAGDAFRQYIQQFTFNAPEIPVIANYTARPYTPAVLIEWLAAQITSPVKWYESVSYVLAHGEVDLYEVGPGDVLTKMKDFIIADPMPAAGFGVTPIVRKPAADNAVVFNTAYAKLLGTADKAALEATAATLGSEAFRKTYNTKYAYAAGAMFYGISSVAFVTRMANAGYMSYFGTGGLSITEVETAIKQIKAAVRPGQPYGMNLWHQAADPVAEFKLAALFVQQEIRFVEAAAYVGLSKAIVYYRLKGLQKDVNGNVTAVNKVMVKLSRPEVAQVFLEPAPEQLVRELVAEGFITAEQAEWASSFPMADDICTEADSAGHTDRRMPYALLPAMRKQRDDLQAIHQFRTPVRVGVAGGLGTPDTLAASFILGADFVLTGSINQCTVEAGISSAVKDMLQEMNIQDTDYVPAGDMFEFGAKVQVLKKGLFFPARATKLYELYKRYDAIEQIDTKDKTQLEERYFRRSLESVFQEIKGQLPAAELEKALKTPKHKMSLIFRRYFSNSLQAALSGNADAKVDYQVHTSAALGAFNQWVKHTPLSTWRNRHGDELATLLMHGAAAWLQTFYAAPPFSSGAATAAVTPGPIRKPVQLV